MVKFKVRPRKEQIIMPCTPELSTLLACFATSGDFKAAQGGECSVAAKSLHSCMANRAVGKKVGKSSINSLLAKVK